MKKITLASMLLFCGYFLIAQNKFTATLVCDSELSGVKKVNPVYSKSFTKFSIYEVETKAIESYLQRSVTGENSTTELNIVFGNKDWKLNLKQYDIRSVDYIYQESNDSKIIIHPKTPTFTYRGYNGTNEKDRVTLAIREGCFSGYIQDKGDFYYIESVNTFDKTASQDHFIIYNAKDIRHGIIGTCSQSQSNVQKILSEPLVSTAKNVRVATKCTEIAVAFDQSYKTKLGGKANAESAIMARINLVSDHYELEFNIEYKLVTIFECKANEFIADNVTESCLEGGGTCQDGTVLKEFSKWGNTPAGFGGVLRDVATFWTGRNLKDGSNTGNIGYSFFAGICNTKGYNIIEDYYTTGNNAHASIWIHELGHTWNAVHVADNSTNMMSPNIYGNTSTGPTNRFVDAGTRSKINAHRDSRTCLDEGCTTTAILPDGEENTNVKGFPNPFESQITISYTLDTEAEIKISVYDVLGQLVYEQRMGKQSKGEHLLTWDGKNTSSSEVPDGIYFATLNSNQRIFKSIQLVKVRF